jgi:hypothetical protein
MVNPHARFLVKHKIAVNMAKTSLTPSIGRETNMGSNAGPMEKCRNCGENCGKPGVQAEGTFQTPRKNASPACSRKR